MQPTHVLMIAATILTLSSTSAFSDTTITFDPLLMRNVPKPMGAPSTPTRICRAAN